MSSGPSYCGYYAKGRCKFGKSCRYSHDEKDSPAVRKQLLETQLQLAMICVLCNVKIVESGHWFGLTTSCSHPLCYMCAEKKTQESVPPKSKNSKKTVGKGCPECQEPIGKICPSGLFMDGKEKKKAFDYYERHESGIWETYLNRDRRTAKCGFSNCSKTIFLDDGTELCPHGQFNQKDLDDANEKKRMETEKRVAHDLWVDRINKTAKMVRYLFTTISIYIFIFAVSIFLISLVSNFEIKLDEIEFWSTIPSPSEPKPQKFFAAYPEIHIQTVWIGDDGFGDDFAELREAKNANNVGDKSDDKHEMCFWHYYLNSDNYYQLCGFENAVKSGFAKNFNY